MDREIAIAAYYEAQPRRHSGRDVLDWAAEAATGVLAAAGLEKHEVDGLITDAAHSGAGGTFWSILVAESLGMSPRFLQSIDIGGGSPIASIARAGAAIKAGQAELVLCVMADAPSTNRLSMNRGYRLEFEDPYGSAGPPGAFGLIVNRYRHQFGDPSEAMAKVAVTQRTHAQLNPNALLRSPMTREDYFNSRVIVDGIRLLDCVMPCDGALAVLVTSGRRAREITKKPVYLTGYAEAHNFHGSDPLPDITVSGFSKSCPEALAQARLRPQDVDMIQPYDDFTIAVIITLEDAGFCAKGEGVDFVLSTNLLFDGDLPLNTSGGQISVGQCGLAAGMIQVVEAVRQLRGEAGARQVSEPRNALCTGIGYIHYARNWDASVAAVFEV